MALLGIGGVAVAVVIALISMPSKDRPLPKELTPPPISVTPTKPDAPGGLSRTTGSADGSVVINLIETADNEGIRLDFEELLGSRPDLLSIGYSPPTRVFRVFVYGSEGSLVRVTGQHPATLKVHLSEWDLLIANGDPYRLAILRYDEDSSEWKPAPTSLDLPWIRAEMNLSPHGHFALAALAPQAPESEDPWQPSESDSTTHTALFPAQTRIRLTDRTYLTVFPVPVSSPTETPRPRPYQVQSLTTATATATLQPSRPPSPVPSVATEEKQLFPPTAPSRMPSPPPSSPTTAPSTPTEVRTPGNSPTPVPGYRLFINGRQVLFTDSQFLVPLGIVTLDRLPGPSSGTFPYLVRS